MRRLGWIGVAAGVLVACGARAHAAPERLERRPAARWLDVRHDVARARGPIEVRDDWMLAQPRMTLPATSPDPLGRGRTEARLFLARGSDFGWNQTETGENPTLRRFLVDGEHQTVALHLRHGLDDRWDVGVRVPVQWRGHGFMDGIIDWWHDLTGTLDNKRPSFDNDRYRIEGITRGGRPFSWNDDRGLGLGSVEVSARYALWTPCCRDDWRVAAIGRLALPTGTGPFRHGGVDVGAQVVVAKRVAPCWEVYSGMGVTWFGARSVRGITYRRLRWNGFLTVEYRMGPRWSLLAQASYSSRLIDDVLAYPASQIYIRAGAKIDLGPHCQLEVGFNENLKSQQATEDFGVFAGLSLEF